MSERPNPRRRATPGLGTIPLDQRITAVERRLRELLTAHARGTNWRRRDGAALIQAVHELHLDYLLSAQLAQLYERRDLRDSLTLMAPPPRPRPRR